MYICMNARLQVDGVVYPPPDDVVQYHRKRREALQKKNR
jgi:hypothetical protein